MHHRILVLLLIQFTFTRTCTFTFAECSVWRYVVVGATVAAAVLTPSTDPFTQMLLAGPLVGLYLGGASVVRALERAKETA